MSNLQTEEQLRRLRLKDAGAMAAVVENHASGLYAAAMSLGVGSVDAEDLVQEAFAAFFGAVERFRGESSLRTYLFGILYNKARQRWSAGWREQPTDPVDQVFERRFDGAGTLRRLEGPEELALTAELAALIADCSNGLSQAQRAAFHLKEVERQDTVAICKILGVSETNLGVLLFRARNKLRECLENKWESDR